MTDLKAILAFIYILSFKEEGEGEVENGESLTPTEKGAEKGLLIFLSNSCVQPCNSCGSLAFSSSSDSLPADCLSNNNAAAAVVTASAGAMLKGMNNARSRVAEASKTNTSMIFMRIVRIKV